MNNYQLVILWISKYRWTGSAKMNTKNDKGENYTITHSGQKDTHQHHRGVALIMNRESANTLMEWEPINERLIKARINSKYYNRTIIQYYAPTNDSEDAMKEEWYEQLQHTPRDTLENTETLWTTPEDSRPHQRPLQKLGVQCNDG